MLLLLLLVLLLPFDGQGGKREMVRKGNRLVWLQEVGVAWLHNSAL